MTEALLPLKDLVEAKSRLSGVLRPFERRALAQAMAEDVLSVLAAHPSITGITLVSDDPGAHLLAAGYGTRYLAERDLGCRGLNPVIATCVDRLLVDGADRLLVLHADLPLLGAADIDAALDCQRETGGLVIGTDRAARGTNLLVFDAASRPDFRFGVDSCARHQAWARDAGVAAAVLQRPGIALDVDEVADLAALLSAVELEPSGRTADLLRRWSGRRIETVLASLAPTGLTVERGMADS